MVSSHETNQKRLTWTKDLDKVNPLMPDGKSKTQQHSKTYKNSNEGVLILAWNYIPCFSKVSDRHPAALNKNNVSTGVFKFCTKAYCHKLQNLSQMFFNI